MYLAQGYNTATLVRIEHPTSRSGVRRSTTRPPHLVFNLSVCVERVGLCSFFLHEFVLTGVNHDFIAEKIMCASYCVSIEDTLLFNIV